MGSNLQWIAVPAGDSATLVALRARLPAKVDVTRTARGWCVFISHDDPIDLNELARFVTSEAVGGWVSETAMVSGCVGLCKGSVVWSVAHDGEEGPTSLQIVGTPPAALRDLHARALAACAREPLMHLFEVPIDLAELLVGFRYDEHNESVPTPGADMPDTLLALLGARSLDGPLRLVADAIGHALVALEAGTKPYAALISEAGLQAADAYEAALHRFKRTDVPAAVVYGGPSKMFPSREGILVSARCPEWVDDLLVVQKTVSPQIVASEAPRLHHELPEWEHRMVQAALKRNLAASPAARFYSRHELQ